MLTLLKQAYSTKLKSSKHAKMSAIRTKVSTITKQITFFDGKANKKQKDFKNCQP
jgi:hypothetical protein